MKMDKVAGSGNDESVISDNMIGQTFNRWKVLARAPNRKEKKYYLCQCSCAKCWFRFKNVGSITEWS